MAALIAAPTLAQTLPAPSRTIFKCEQEGKVIYSDAPCLGAQRIDVEPTRGVNKISGAERTGKDVRNERTNEMLTEIWRPLLNETTEQRAKRHRRAKLGDDVQAQCRKLDRGIAGSEAQEMRTHRSEREEVQKRLHDLRLTYRELKC